MHFGLRFRLIFCALACAATGASAGMSDADLTSALQQYRATLERPLFAPSRRPPAPVAKAPVAPKEEPKAKVVLAAVQPEEPAPMLRPSSLQLRGVLRRGGRSIALVEHRASGAVHALELGRTSLPAENGKEIDVDVLSITPTHVMIFAGQKLMLGLRGGEDLTGIERVQPDAGAGQWAQDVEINETGTETIAGLVPTGIATQARFTIQTAVE